MELFKQDSEANGEYNYISQLAVVTIKSLMPMENEEGVGIDQNRFLEELRLWKYYNNGSNQALIKAIDLTSADDYWTVSDNSIISRIIPIVIANQKEEAAEEEVIKNILFTTGELENLFESVLILHLLLILISNRKSEDIISILKDKIIKFSQTQYLEKYRHNYRNVKFPKNFQIEFEREKINALNALNGAEVKKYNNLKDCLSVLEGYETSSLMGKILYNYLYNEDVYHNIPKFYLNLGEYILNLRKSRIEPEKLKIDKYILPDIFSFEEGEVFYHSLLKNCKVIEKAIEENKKIVTVQTKTGIYVFKNNIQ